MNQEGTSTSPLSSSPSRQSMRMYSAEDFANTYWEQRFWSENNLLQYFLIISYSWRASHAYPNTTHVVKRIVGHTAGAKFTRHFTRWYSLLPMLTCLRGIDGIGDALEPPLPGVDRPPNSYIVRDVVHIVVLGSHRSRVAPYFCPRTLCEQAKYHSFITWNWATDTVSTSNTMPIIPIPSQRKTIPKNKQNTTKAQHKGEYHSRTQW